MTQRSPAPWLPWLLGILTILVMIGTVSHIQPIPSIDPRIGVIMIGLVAFIVAVEVPLQGHAISLGYAAGLLAYLILGVPGATLEAFAVMAIGGAAGGLLRAIWQLRQSGRRLSFYLIEWPIVAAAQMTLSMAVAGTLYQMLGGRLPLVGLGLRDLPPLAIMILASASVYLGIYRLALWWLGLRGGEIFNENRVMILLTFAIPIPFVIVAAMLFPLSLPAFIILTVSLIGLAIGATAIGYGQIRYRQRVLELQSISNVSRALRTSLDLDSLLEMIYLQVATLLKVNNFMLVLYDPARKLLTFPLVRQRWQKVTIQPRRFGLYLTDHVIGNKTPLLLTDDVAARAKKLDLDIPPELSGPKSWLGVPLVAPDRPLGCIVVVIDDTETDQPDRRFTEHDQRLLLTIATQSGVAIENAQLYRQSQERASQVARMNNLSTQLSGTLNSGLVLDMLAQATVEVAAAGAASVFMWGDEARSKLVLTRSVGLSAQFVEDMPLPLSSGQDRQPIVVSNVRMDSRTVPIREAMKREQINSWIELPLSNGDQSIGVLVAYYRTPREFTGDETELLRTFANQSALSINNAHLYRRMDEALDRRVEQLSALAAINKELSSTLDLENVFKLLLDRAIEGTESDSGKLLLSDPELGLEVAASRGGKRKTGSLDPSDLLKLESVRQAFETGHPASEQITSPAGKIESRLAVPIVHDDQTLGVIILESQIESAYDSDEISFVMQLATQATIAIDNARIFEWIHQSHNRLQAILNSLHEAVILFEMSGKITIANPRVSHLLGVDSASIIYQNVDTLLERPDLLFAERLGFDAESLRTLFDRLREGNIAEEHRYSYRLDFPEVRFLDRICVPVLDEEQKRTDLLMVFSDATEERMQAQAREDLSRMIVHDLRSPLTAINTSMKLLNETNLPDNAAGRSIRKTADISQRALRKLLNLVDSLLDIAKMEGGSMSLDIGRFDLRLIAEGVRLELSPLAEELNIRIDIEIPVDLPALPVDGNKIERVLLNLVDNALKFSPVDAVIVIRAQPEDNNLVRVEVVDTGPGIPDDYKERIFDRFQQVDGNQKGHRRGTGLGLTFCRLTIEAHGGQIWIEDNPDGGSIFVIVLPMASIKTVGTPESAA